MSSSTQITPTVGRKVWYYEHSQQSAPMDATVIKVHDFADSATPTTPVNLLVIEPDTGRAIFRPFIVFHDESEQHPSEHYRWMPYQTKAAATEAPTLATETKVYTDGTSATGPGSLPDESPAQQDGATSGESA